MGHCKIRCLLVDDHQLVLQGICAHLSMADDLDVTATATTAAAGLAALADNSIDVAIIDLGLPDLPGLELIKRMQALQPTLGIVVLTMHNDEAYVLRAISLGVDSYLLKEQSPEELLAAIRAVYAGYSFFSPRITSYLVSQLAGNRAAAPMAVPLTGRERQVLEGIAIGKASRGIAEELCLSPRTVQTYRDRLMTKLDLHSVADLTRYAVAHGLVGTTTGLGDKGQKEPCENPT